MNIPERGQRQPETDKTVRHADRQYGNGTLNVAAYSPDGKTVAIGGSLGVWLLSDDLKPVAHLIGDTFSVTALAWNPNGKQLATTDFDNVVQLWDVASGKANTLERLPFGKKLQRQISYSPDGARLATASRNSGVKIWDTTSGKLLSTIQADGEVYSVAWHKDGKRLAVGGANGEQRDQPMVVIYDVETRKILASFKAEVGEGYGLPAAPIENLQWIENGKRLVVVPPMGQSVNPVSWNPETAEIEHIEVFVVCGAVATGFYLSSDGQHYVAALQSCESGASWADIYHLGGSVAHLVAGYGAIRSIAWHPDNRHFIMVWGTSAITLYDLAQLNADDRTIPILQRFELFGKADDTFEPPEYSGYYDDPEWEIVDPSQYENPTASPDGKLIAAYGPSEATLETFLFDTGTGANRMLENLRVPKPSGGCRMYCGPHYEWSPDGSRLKAEWFGGTTVVWDVSTERILFSTITPARCLWGAGNSVLLCSVKDDAVYALEAKTGRRLKTLHEKFIGEIVWGPQKRSVALIGTDNRIQIWNKTFDSQLQDIPGTSLAWSKDGSRLIVVESIGAMTLYNTATGKPIASMRGPEERITHTVFSPNGKLLATTFEGGEIDIWDTTKGQRLLRLIGHRGDTDVEWKDDSTQIVSRGRDATSRVWTVR